MVERYVGLMSSKIFLKIVQLDTLMCICLSDVGINIFYIKWICIDRIYILLYMTYISSPKNN